MGVNSITIYGEIDNKDVDFACYISKYSRQVTNLTISKDLEKSLTLSMYFTFYTLSKLLASYVMTEIALIELYIFYLLDFTLFLPKYFKFN